MKEIKNHCILGMIILLIAMISDNLNAQTYSNNNAVVKSVNPLVPFGAITGKPTKEQLDKYLDSFKKVGIDQFMIYPRSGLELEYMSEEWLDVCEDIIKYAAENGISIWIYDEYNWPSGSCKGQVIKDNERFAGKKISVWADPVNFGKGNYFWSISDIPIYTDLLNPQAVKLFLTLTHEKYYERFHQYFGTVIKGFFSDEPSPMYAASCKTSGSTLELIYWDSLEDKYYQLTHRDFRLDVEKHLNGNTPSDLWQNYFYLLGQQFKTVFFDQIKSWCDQHNVLYTGHLMSESDPQSSLWYNGDPMNVIKSFSIPGIDEIFTNTDIEKVEWVTMKMIEAAASNTNRGAFAELFAVGPCDLTLGKRRQMIWLTALHGVDHFLMAISPIDSRANLEKPDYYNPQTKTQPWFEALNELGEDAKKAALFAQKRGVQKIAVRYPQSLMASSQFVSKEGKPAFNLQQLLKNLIRWQWDPKLIAEDESDVSGYQAVLSLTAKGIMEEKSGKEIRSLDELSSWLDNKILRIATVESKKGKRLEDVLIKKYDDGSVCVVSLLDTPQGEVVLKQPGSAPILFELPENGVFTYSLGQPVLKIDNVLELPVEKLLPYRLSSDNTVRAVFDKTGTFEFVLNNTLNNLSVAVRNYKDTVRLSLDGKNLPTTIHCHFLPEGLKELYLESERISLDAGKHTLSLKTESGEYSYLPSAFIGGELGVLNGDVLSKLPETVSIASYREQGLKEYTGSISFSNKIHIGKYEYLSINTQGLVAEILINGVSIGEKAWASFRWKIPAIFRNQTVDLEVRIWTSVGPLFGDYPRTKGTEVPWLKQFAPK